MPNPVKDGYQTLTKSGWNMPTMAATTSSFLLFWVAFYCMWAVFILSLVEDTAKNSQLMVPLVATCAGLWLIWVIMVLLTSNRMWAAEACSGVRQLSGSYDGCGSFYLRMRDSKKGRPSEIERQNDSDWTWGGIKFAPKISNNMVIKGAFAVKCVFKVISIFCNLARGYIVEAGGNEDTYQILSFVVMGCSGIIILDALSTVIVGGERGPFALVGQRAYRTIYGKIIPFQPVDSKVHACQQLIVAAELSPWGVLIPLLHQYVYGIEVTTSWAVPLLSDYILLVYTSGAIYHKGCAAAYMMGLALYYNKISKPPATRIQNETNVQGMVYSIWGPYIELNDAELKDVNETAPPETPQDDEPSATTPRTITV